eukprot:4450113-Pyramimonas_sp.AAC.1
MAMMEATQEELKGQPGGEVVDQWLRLANSEMGQQVAGETFRACRVKGARIKADQSEELKKTKVTVNLNKWADFRTFELEPMER